MTQRARTSISHAPTRSLTAPNAGRPACPTAESQRGEQGTATLGEDAAHECDAADRAGRRHLSTPSCHCGAQARESYRSADPAHRPSFPRPASSSRRVAVSSSGAALCAERVADERRRLLDKSVADRCGGSWKTFAAARWQITGACGAMEASARQDRRGPRAEWRACNVEKGVRGSCQGSLDWMGCAGVAEDGLRSCDRYEGHSSRVARRKHACGGHSTSCEMQIDPLGARNTIGARTKT